MYTVKCAVPEFKVDIVNCMYEMFIMNKSIPLSSDSPVNDDHHVGSALADIRMRHEKVLQQLAALRQQLESIKLPSDSEGVEANTAQLRHDDLATLVGKIIINIPTDYAPYALLSMLTIWKRYLSFNIKTFTHSSVSPLAPQAEHFDKKLKMLNANDANAPQEIIIIWKNCCDIEMSCSTMSRFWISGEENILRALTRCGPNQCSYIESSAYINIERVLDITFQLQRRPNIDLSKAQDALHNCMKNCEYFGGNEMSIADMTMYSLLKRRPAFTSMLTPTLKAWHQRAQRMLEL